MSYAVASVLCAEYELSRPQQQPTPHGSVHFDDLLAAMRSAICFPEVAQKRWMDVGGADGRQFRALAERVPLVCHGPPINLSGHAPRDVVLPPRLHGFIKDIDARCYLELLSFRGDHAHLCEMIPLLITAKTGRHVAGT